MFEFVNKEFVMTRHEPRQLVMEETSSAVGPPSTPAHNPQLGEWN